MPESKGILELGEPPLRFENRCAGLLEQEEGLEQVAATTAVNAAFLGADPRPGHLPSWLGGYSSWVGSHMWPPFHCACAAGARGS